LNSSLDKLTKRRFKKILAQESAKIIVTQGIENFSDAKNKAAKNLNIENLGCLPSNYEIEKSLKEHYQLFVPVTHAEYVELMRETAIEIMNLFIDFQAYVVGPVVSGTASSSSSINIHLGSENVCDVTHVLDKNEIKYKFFDKKIKFNKKVDKVFCGVSLLYRNMVVEIVMFNSKDIKQSPLSRIDGKPIKRLKINSLKKLL
tara:strand:+ start:26745 stop:27350 length:606 start_codon:yes stop_codon:yes gene_type:complete